MTSIDFDKKWASYVLAGGAMLALPTVTHAGPIHLFSGDSDGIVSATLDVDGDGSIDFNFFADGTPGFRDTYANGAGTNTISLALPTFIRAYQPGQVVDGTAVFGAGGSFLRDEYKSTPAPHIAEKGKWNNNINQTSYMGLKFLIGTDVHYGWAAVSVALGSATLDVTDWGYETAANTGATIPGAPEPASMALMLLGAAGVAALKLRRKSNQNN